jgi:tetratricopeptide (TPR) repeat protein
MGRIVKGFGPCLGWAVLSGTILLCLLFPVSGFAQVSHIEEAARLLSQGDATKAEAEARLGLGNPETRPLALAMLGTIRLQEGKYEGSVTFLTKALALNPRLVGARTSLGDAYTFLGKRQLARKSYQRVLELDPENVNARLGWAKLEATQQNFGKSLSLAQPIIPQLNESEDGLMLLATDYGALGNKQALEGLVDQWRHLASTSDESSLAFGTLLGTHGLTSQAKEILDAEQRRVAAAASPTLAVELGKAYISVGSLDDAEHNFQLALSLNPDCTACEYGLAQIAERQLNTEKALAYLIAAKKREPDNPEILFEFGKVCLERNLLEDALPALSKAVALKPDRDDYAYMLGSAYVSKAQLGKAMAVFAALLKKHPQDAMLNYAIGTVYFLQGKYAEAESSLKRSLDAKPDQAAASYYLGLTYDAVGQDDRAIDIFRDLMKRHPDYAPTYAKVGTMLLRKHQYDEARQDLERAIALDPQSVEAHYQLGLLLRRLGKTSESEQELAESRKLENERHAQTDVHLRLMLPD